MHVKYWKTWGGCYDVVGNPIGHMLKDTPAHTFKFKRHHRQRKKQNKKRNTIINHMLGRKNNATRQKIKLKKT